MMSSKIDFSAQFGGRAAAAFFLPHFQLLKAVAKSYQLSDFPFPMLAFIFRVDGDVKTYGLSGPGNIDIDRHGEYLSVDIGLQEVDLKRADISTFIAGAIKESLALLTASGDEKLKGIEIKSVRTVLDDMCTDYQAKLAR